MNTKILYLLMGLFAPLFFFASTPQSNGAILTGKVNINWSKTIKLSSGAVTLTDSWIDRLNVGDTLIDLSADGSFRIQIPLEKADFYTLSHEGSEMELFLSPNDSLYIDFSAETPISGTSAQLNAHLSSLRRMINANRKYINQIRLYNYPRKRFNAVLDSLETVYLDTYQQFKKEQTIHPSFEQKIIADITYRHKLTRIAHPAVYLEQHGERLSVPKTYFEDLAQNSFQNPDLLKSVDYVLFLNSYLDTKVAGEYRFGIFWEAPVERIHPRYEQIKQLNAHQEIKDYLFHEHLHQSMDSYGVHYLGDLIPRFRTDCTNPEFIRRIEARFKAGMERRAETSEIKIYKRVGNIELEAHIFYPEGFKASDQRPAYVFFHGGGWAIGFPEWGYRNCKKYSSKGMVAISFEYRIIDIHGSNIIDCVKDAKSAILWTREQAQSLGIDPNKIVAAGFSAGGHLAACTAILKDYEPENPKGISTKPNAIVVHSASYNTMKSDFFAKQTEQNPMSISTFHQLKKGLVPAIFFHGTRDHLAPISEFTEFRDKMDALGNDYEYKIFEGVGHFFNSPSASQTVREMTEAFLVKLGYIEE